jgi:hypothetical protein
LHDGLGVEGESMCREEGEGVSNGDVDYCDVGSVLGRNGTVISGLGGGIKDVL